MQRQKKIQKSKELKEGVRARTEGSHQERFESVLRAGEAIRAPIEGAVEIRVSRNGSCKLPPLLDQLRTPIAKRDKVVLRGNTGASEKLCQLVEMVKAELGVGPERVRGQVDGKGDLVFAID